MDYWNFGHIGLSGANSDCVHMPEAFPTSAKNCDLQAGPTQEIRDQSWTSRHLWEIWLAAITYNHGEYHCTKYAAVCPDIHVIYEWDDSIAWTISYHRVRSCFYLGVAFTSVWKRVSVHNLSIWKWEFLSCSLSGKSKLFPFERYCTRNCFERDGKIIELEHPMRGLIYIIFRLFRLW